MTTLLRHGDRTVEELALALGLTGDAVRGHLATMKREGLWRQVRLACGTRRGMRSRTHSPYQEVLEGFHEGKATQPGFKSVSNVDA